MCDGCKSWQHRTCKTGISREDYRRAVREGLDVNWSCTTCSSVQDIAVHDCPEDHLPTPTQALVDDINSENDLDEDTLDNDTLDCSEAHPPIITYEKICASSQRGKQKLVDSLGFSYTFKRKTHVGVHWRCAVRNKKVTCNMIVKEVNGVFIRGANEHSHPPEACPLTTSEVSKLIKDKAMDDVFRPALEIVEEVLLEHVDPTKPTASLPAPVNLARQANRKRRANRPAEPSDLTFGISEEHIPPNFLKSDISVGDKRHLLFVTQEQLQLLAKARNWYVDGTFKVVRRPFTQLFSIHTFISVMVTLIDDGKVKQTPLLFLGVKDCALSN